MPTIRCVEPGLAATGPDKSVVEAKPGSDTEIQFPHVDSCLAIAFIMENGGFIGGHVGMQNPGQTDLLPYANAMKMCGDMLALAGAHPIQCQILVGGGETWTNNFWEGGKPGTKDIIKAIRDLTKCKNSYFGDSGEFPSGVDVSLNPRRKMAFVKNSKGNHGFALQLPFTQVVGHSTKIIPNK